MSIWTMGAPIKSVSAGSTFSEGAEDIVLEFLRSLAIMENSPSTVRFVSVGLIGLLPDDYVPGCSEVDRSFTGWNSVAAATE